MKTPRKLKEIIEEIIKEYSLNEEWYHGTPDSREIEKNNRFPKRKETQTYISNPQEFLELQHNLNSVERESDKYFKILDKVSGLKKQYTYNKPIFLTNNINVAGTYADPKRAFDYQGAVEKIYRVDVNCIKRVKIFTKGSDFNSIKTQDVKEGLIESGIDENKIINVIHSFNFYRKNVINTATIAAIGSFLGVDCIELVNVLDSYQGGNVKSNVLMVLNPDNVKIKN